MSSYILLGCPQIEPDFVHVRLSVTHSGRQGLSTYCAIHLTGHSSCQDSLN
jgi:hypothetical protein